MKEEAEAQTEHTVWVEKNDRILTFRETEGFEKLTFRSQEDKMSYVYHLCDSGYRIQ